MEDLECVLIRDEIAQLDRERSQLTIPDLLKDLFWYNTRPLSFEQDLKGKIVLFDFWTYCCINCLHVLPDLNYLENKFKDCPFVVIGVHSAKFANEKSENNLEANIRKLHIKHPIVNDPELSFWHALGIHSWPSFALMGPFGNLLFTTSGEGKRDLLEEWIEESLSFYQKDLIYTALPQQLTKTHPHTLKYPTRLAEDPLSSLLWISDSGNNRVIGVNRQTVIKEEFAGTHFNGPQGLLWFQNQLYVADTDHHVLQKIDLATKTVETILGTYTQGFDYVGGGIGPNQPISSPWALALAEDESGLYIAMAGTHQIWFYQFSTKRGFAISGSGHERMLDGPALKAGWAQPSGLSIGAWNHDEHLFVADSESSSIRALLPQKNALSL
jgi:Redoxin.